MGWTKKDTDSFGETIDWDDTPEFIGVFKSSKTIDTDFGENSVYKFTGEDGEDYECWGSAALNRGLEDVEKGDKVRIVYNGMVKGKGGRRSHNFDVYVSDGDDDDEVAAKRARSKSAKSAPAKKASPAKKVAASKRSKDEDAY